MDFDLAFQVGALLSVVIISATTVSFLLTLRGIRKRVTTNTFVALLLFAGACVFLTVSVVMSAFVQGTVVQRPVLMAFFLCTINCAIHVGTSSRRLPQLGLAITLGVTALTVAFTATTPTETSPVLIAATAVVFSTSLLLAIWLVLTAYSPFTVGLVLLNVSFLLSWATIIQGLVAEGQQAFMLIFLPVVVSGSVLGSLLKPWRRAVMLFTLFALLLTCIPIAMSALLTSSIIDVWLFALGALFVGLVAIAPLEYFVEQATEGGTRIPRYMAVMMIVIALLAASHSVVFGLIETLGTQPEAVLFVEWIMGLVGVVCFTMAAHYSLLKPQAFAALRLILISFSSVLLVLGNYYVRGGRWVYDTIFPYLALMIVIGIIGYLIVAQRLRAAGAGRAGRNFVVFSLMALMYAIVIFTIEDLGPILGAGLTVLCGVMLAASSPIRLRPRVRKQ
ncbi:MAG: hypothetical protein HXY34_00605 [Candidatus Thorarchaeota archaeon]|nr:hypothetical protein [Candidatus Thorarchaeota archaeon]